MKRSGGDLKKHLSVTGGTILILNIMLGSGLLILPGLVYESVGSQAIYSWAVAGAVTFPILLVIIQLGKSHPSAGGVPHYASLAFGRYMQLLTSLLFLGAVSLGLPSIAITGGYYISAFFNHLMSPHIYAAGIIVVSGVLALLNVKQLGNVINTLGSIIIAIIVLFIVLCGIALFSVGRGAPLNFDIDVKAVFSPFMMVFFSFAGWEITAHLTEEFERPERDFPISMLVSFFIITVLYLISAWLVQALDISSHPETALASVVGRLLGSGSGLLVPIFAFLLVFANLFGATWAVSRLMYYLANEQYIPALFTKTTNGIPVRTVILTSALLLSVVLASYFNLLDIGYMFSLAGQNFFLI